MSEAIIFEYPYNLFLKQRLEFVVICQDHLAASIMRIVEYEMLKLKEAWQDKVVRAIEEKKTPPKDPKAYWIRLSQGQIIAKLYMYDSLKVKSLKREGEEESEEYKAKKTLSISKSTLKKALDLLKEKGFLLERAKPGDEFGAPLYTLHKEHVQKALKALPENPFTIFLPGGVSIFERGGESQDLDVPPAHFESGKSQNNEAPLSENESPQSQNLRVFKDSKDNPERTKDTEQEDTSLGSLRIPLERFKVLFQPRRSIRIAMAYEQPRLSVLPMMAIRIPHRRFSVRGKHSNRTSLRQSQHQQKPRKIQLPHRSLLPLLHCHRLILRGKQQLACSFSSIGAESRCWPSIKKSKPLSVRRPWQKTIPANRWNRCAPIWLSMIPQHYLKPPLRFQHL